MPQAAALAGQENLAILYRPGFLAGRTHPNQAAGPRAQDVLVLEVAYRWGSLPAGQAEVHNRMPL